jgi:Flp pilus assembly protein TadG
MNPFFPRRAPRRASRLAASTRRRRGISLWLFVATLPLICGTCGLVIDLGQLHARRAQAQRAADAAALAGAQVSGTDNSKVEPKADYYAESNGFSSARGDTVSVETNYNSSALEYGVPTNTVKVAIAHQEPVFFAPIAETLLSFMGWSDGAAQFSRQVTARAVARRFVYIPMSTGGNYGIASGSEAVVNNIINGPYCRYEDADPWSGRFLDDGNPNPRYAETGGYSNFLIKVDPSTLDKFSDGKLYVQVFDPDSYNATSNEYDLHLSLNSKIKAEDLTARTGPETRTRYELFKQDPGDPKLWSPVPGADINYGGSSQADMDANMKWVTPPNFAVDLNTFKAGTYKLRISTTDGNWANDYALRAGPLEGTTMDDHTWNQTYGDKLGADPNNVLVPMNSDGRLVIGFRSNGTAQLKLGYLGAEYAGKTVMVTHFDLDINARSLNYVLDSMPTWSQGAHIGTRAEENGRWNRDLITLPGDFKGGNLSAQYAAGVDGNGAFDGSSWELFGEGDGDGVVRLIE